MTAFQTQPKKGDGFFRFQSITGAQIRILQRFSLLSFLLSVYGLAFFFLFSYSCYAFPHFFFLLLLYGLAFPHFFTARHVTNAAVSLWESDKNTIFTMYEWWRSQRYRTCLKKLDIRIGIEELNFFLVHLVGSIQTKLKLDDKPKTRKQKIVG